MCNVIHLYYRCQHTLRLRRSRCKGTKHKMTRTSIKAACTAESFLTVYARTECNTCEHASWESDWTCKLERARTFLSKLIERRMLGTPEVSALVKELEDQYHRASWGARNISHAFKKSVARVSVSDYRIVRSPLKQEVQPEDVVDLKEKDWAEMDDHDYDGDYIASTDPIHPVSTDHSHPPDDDDDGSWIFNHFSSEELEASNDGEVVLDFDQTRWRWDNDNSENSIPIRKLLEQRLQDDADRTKYYSDLLLVSRWEARAFEGPGGRFIPDPPMVSA
ncbi:hypothetical protein CC77DRAFT_924934 [Alternaria alternata]|uniref:Uncharacterized protein n=1 Tax=Alternaria alternata TaxID=5599 RepID=A0A177E5T7_ALTAL|nr:hypothetical protein CC77DRAFT_924934 [Alternaria alternata]OAG26582.1 hypothetical protein CC77DRAFT_924934 [Alternaria alternata]